MPAINQLIDLTVIWWVFTMTLVILWPPYIMELCSNQEKQTIEISQTKWIFISETEMSPSNRMNCYEGFILDQIVRDDPSEDVVWNFRSELLVEAVIWIPLGRMFQAGEKIMAIGEARLKGLTKGWED